MIPKYTLHEIKMLLIEKSRDSSQALIEKSLWTTEDYKQAAKILETDVEQLTAMLPAEDLSNISFRALENTEEIITKVSQLDEIFELLTYQLKIGTKKHG